MVPVRIASLPVRQHIQNARKLLSGRNPQPTSSPGGRFIDWMNVGLVLEPSLRDSQSLSATIEVIREPAA